MCCENELCSISIDFRVLHHFNQPFRQQRVHICFNIVNKQNSAFFKWDGILFSIHGIVGNLMNY